MSESDRKSPSGEVLLGTHSGDRHRRARGALAAVLAIALPAVLLLALLFGLLLAPATAAADAGVLIPWNVSHDPDPAVLSLRRMDVKVHIEHLHARVDVRQIFENHTDQQLEGRYVFPLGERAQVVDFSLWEGAVRLPGTVVEKQKGRRIFEELAARAIDPGLLEKGEEKDEQAMFVLRVAPIRPRATARIELTYTEELPLSSLGTSFVLPLRPQHYQVQRAAELHLEVSVDGPYPLSSLRLLPSERFQVGKRDLDGGRLQATWDGRDVELAQDVTLELGLGGERADTAFLAYRDPKPRQDLSAFGGEVYSDTRGFFLARQVVRLPSRAKEPHDVVVLLDTSLSMQWEKLERSFTALRYLLSRLGPNDRFGLVLFNDEVSAYKPEPVAASKAEIAAALEFVRRSSLSGGTDLGAALAAGVDLLRRGQRRADRAIVLISDGNPTVGEVGYRKLGDLWRKKNRGQSAGALFGRLFVFGVGDDAASTLLGTLAEASSGVFVAAGGAGDLSFLMRSFADKLEQGTLRGATLTLPSAEQVYPKTVPLMWGGSDLVFTGRYTQPSESASLVVKGMSESGAYERQLEVKLPEEDKARPWVGRAWAKERIDDLVARIDLEGEKPAWVKEIIALAKEFHLVTPYTSFIAAARALLRPRHIKPGDPVLRVKVAPDIQAVTAIFPFGLVKQLHYLEAEDLFETRFLAPPWMTDGTYSCVLVLSDRAGQRFREEKSFVIDSRPPSLRVAPLPPSVAAGDRLVLTVFADADTRRLSARLGEGGASWPIEWDGKVLASRGEVLIPEDLPPGRYPLVLVAEDFAHNLSSQILDVVVMGRR